MTDAVEPAAVVSEPAPLEPRRSFGVTSLVLGILLVLGVVLWAVIGSSLLLVLVWVFPLVLTTAIVIAAAHVVVAALALGFGVGAIVRDRGRVTGVLGILLTLVATAAAALVGYVVVEFMGVLGS